MLKKQFIVRHPVFGNIRIDSKYEKVLNLKPFLELTEKSQLGGVALSKKYANAKHSRFLHSIGVFYLTGKLLDICQSKFGDYISISERDREVLQLAALGHDIGHIAFSHALEYDDQPSHEERTINLFKRYSKEINNIFGYDIVSDVIQLFISNIDIKKKCDITVLDDKIDVQFIFKSLLVGTIDCDRMEYLTTDRFNVYGELVDYTEIFQHISIVLLEGSPILGFDIGALPIIENLLLNRFSQYSEIYFNDDSVISEMAIKRYMKITNRTYEEIVGISECDFLSELKHTVIFFHNGCMTTDSVAQYRLANLIRGVSNEGFFYKKFDSKIEFDIFYKKLLSIISNKDVIMTNHKKATIYNPLINKVYIVDDNGVVKDIMDISKKLKDCSIDYYYVMIDVRSAMLNDIDKRRIDSLFGDNEIEIEKKFIITCPIHDIDLLLNYVSETLAKVPNIIFISNEWSKKNNMDQYYIVDKTLNKDIAIRYRLNEDSYYIKIPASDGTSITKREEQKIFCKTEDEFLKLLNTILRSRGFSDECVSISKGIYIDTKRYQKLVSIYNSIIEVSFDFSTYEYNGEISYGFMVECELKEGEDISLWYLSSQLKNSGFIETNDSKLTRAKKALLLQ